MNINRSYIVAAVAVVAIALWFVFNSLGEDRDIYADVNGNADTVTVLPTVVVRDVRSETYPLRAEIYGRTAPARSVDVKAKTAAAVVSAPVAEGARVSRGTVICRQDVDARQAVVDQARAAVAKAESDLVATERLVERGFKSATSLPGDRANLDAARAQLRQAENELDNVIMRAPFAGIFEERMAEVGDYLGPGQACGRVVELDPVLVEAELTETQVGNVAVGDTLTARLATGQDVQATLRFVEAVANPATRTFRMEAEIPNPDLAIKAGVSATLRLGLGDVEATRIPASVLTLSDTGETGVRIVDASDRIVFVPITIIDETVEGVWVTGLPSSARLVIEGQDFVSDGAEVEVSREASSGSSRVATIRSD